MDVAVSLRRRRLAVLAAFVAATLVSWLALGHRGAHIARALLFPGAGLIDEQPIVAVLCLTATIAATIAWLRWGADWLVAATAAVSVALSAWWTGSHEGVVVAAVASRSAHEFPLVLVVVALVAWLRSLTVRLPFVAAWASTRHHRTNGLVDAGTLHPTERSRTAAVLALAGGDHSATAERLASDPAVVCRARRVGAVARLRVGADPLRRDHAHARAALVLAGAAAPGPAASIVDDARRNPLGVLCSEPGWVRPLDATLSAIALSRLGGDPTRWRRALEREFALHRGHRAAWWWTPLGVGAGSMPAWEHAATTALAKAAGWIDDDRDWVALRRLALGASARGTRVASDERLIAAGRMWATLVDDADATRLLARPTVRHDPLAVALDLVATRLRSDPHVLRPSEGNVHA